MPDIREGGREPLAVTLSCPVESTKLFVRLLARDADRIGIPVDEGPREGLGKTCKLRLEACLSIPVPRDADFGHAAGAKGVTALKIASLLRGEARGMADPAMRLSLRYVRFFDILCILAVRSRIS